MLRRVSSLKGYSLQAIDGRLGAVSDLLFDDVTWKTRWIVVDTGGWLTGRTVLIHLSTIGQPDDLHKLLPVNLTMARIQASPSILDHQPVSRQIQANLIGYYGCDPQWGWSYDGMAYPLMAPPSRSEAKWSNGYDVEGRVDDEGDPHLRSVSAVTGYYIHAVDGNIGHVESFLVDDQGWGILYLVVDTRNWWHGDHVLVAPAAVAEIDWLNSKVDLLVTREQVRASRAWQAEAALPEKDRANLYSQYK